MTEAAASAAAEAPKQSGRVFPSSSTIRPSSGSPCAACRRANRTGGRVALLHVTDDEEFRQFIGVSR
jgi:hypothetical protein